MGVVVDDQGEAAIDYWVDRYDPDAVRRVETSARGRHVEVKPPDSGTGCPGSRPCCSATTRRRWIAGWMAMARAVCDGDPRTMTQRRSDALGAWGHGGDRLACGCGDPHCEAAAAAQRSGDALRIAEQNSLSDDTAAQLDGAGPAGPTREQLRNMTIAQALAQPPATGPANTNPAVIMGGRLLPAPLLAAKLATTARIRPVIHPGDSPPEPRYTPSAGWPASSDAGT